MPVLFQISAPCSSVKPLLPVHQYHIVTPAAAGHFSATYQNSGPPFMDNCSLNKIVDYLLTIFNVTCTNILDTVAPFKQTKRPRPKSDPWLNNDTRALRRSCRKAERKWKKDKLQISFTMLRDPLFLYQDAVRKAKTKYLSDIITKHSYGSRVLFNTIYSVVNPPSTTHLLGSPVTCENFLRFFVGKVDIIRSHITPPPMIPLFPSSLQLCLIISSRFP